MNNYIRSLFNYKYPGVIILVLLILVLLYFLSYRTVYNTNSMPSHQAVTSTSQQPVSYNHDIKPLLEKRCVVCHSCYDAPCQLKLSSGEGITRGANS